MDGSLLSLLSVIAGLLLRFGLPVLVTLFLVWIFRRLDSRWQAEAEAIPGEAVPNRGCWKVHNCPEEKRAGCAAYQHQDKPCWQVHREISGRLPERCFGCEVFRTAPVPIIH